MKKSCCILLCFVIFLSCSNVTPANGACKTTTNNSKVLAQSDLSPLQILILDIQEVQRLIQEGDNQTAIVILKSAFGQVRKVKEFNKNTKKITEKRIKKGIKLLKQNKSQEALDLLQTGIDELIESGLVPSETFD